MDRYNRRLGLFQKYSQNLELWHPEHKGKYICPLCLYVFDETAIENPIPSLTLEHCIPDGLGKTIFLLTCSACNNTGGSTVDNHLHRRADFKAFMTGKLKETFRGRMTVGGHTVTVSVNREERGLHMRVQGKSSDPKEIEAIEKMAVDGNQPDGFVLNLNNHHSADLKRSRVSILKSAYLLMFRDFGYGFILSQNLESVRSQISNPESDAVPLGSIVFQIPPERLPATIARVKIPEGLGGIGVPVHLSKRNEGFFVILPTDAFTYEKWKSFSDGVDKSKSIRFSGDNLPPDDSELTQKGFSWG